MPSGKMIQYYKDKGYDAKCRKPLVVKVEDLPQKSMHKIEVLCDMCHKNKMSVAYESYNESIRKSGSYVCKECSKEKIKQINQEKYGTPYPIQTDFFKEKRKHTCLERYGVDNYAKTKECSEKIKQTCLEKYNVECVLQSEDVRSAIKQTCLNRYGFEHPMHNEAVKKKQKNSLYARYGVNTPLEHDMFKEKIVNTMYKNGTQRTSKQQYYLHKLYGGELNYPIKYYDVDICMLNEKIAIEYDGSGHNLSVKLGYRTQEELDDRELVRFNVIKKEGYKQIRIISRRDKLPSDNVLLKMLSDAIQYFSETGHSWINYDIDNSKMINAENKDEGGAFYDYGYLRRIKESA